MSNPFSKSNHGLILFKQHKQGLLLAENFFDLTLHQQYFLQLMVAEDIQNEITFNAKFDALCKANGVKIEEDSSRFNSSNDIKQQALERIRKRREKEAKNE